MINCFPKIAAIPAAKPPTTPVTKIKRYGFPPSSSNWEIFLASIKSLALLKKKLKPAQNTNIAKKGTKNTAALFKGINKAVAKAAVMIDHQGKNKDRTIAKTRVAIKLVIFLVITCWC